MHSPFSPSSIIAAAPIINRDFTQAILTQGSAPCCKSYPASFQIGTHLTNASHSGHPAVAVGRRLLLAFLREEVVDLIIIPRAAAQTLPHQRRAHKVGLCMGGKHIFLSY